MINQKFYLQNLPNLKNKVDKLGIDKLVPVPVDLSKSSNVVKNKVVKKTEYNTKIKNIKDKMPDINNLATKTILNTKINEVEIKILSINGLGTTSTLNFVENKVPSVSNLVKKQIRTQKLMKLKRKLLITKHDKYIATPEFNKLTVESFAAGLTYADFVTKIDFDNNLSNFNRKITSNKTKSLVIENE